MNAEQKAQERELRVRNQEIRAVRQPTKIERLKSAIHPAVNVLPPNSLPSWKNHPLEQKFPVVPSNKGTFSYGRNAIGESIFVKQHCKFDLEDPLIQNTPIQYNSLHDTALRDYFLSKPELFHRLQDIDLVEADGSVKTSLREYNLYRRYLARLRDCVVKKDLNYNDNLNKEDYEQLKRILYDETQKLSKAKNEYQTRRLAVLKEERENRQIMAKLRKKQVPDNYLKERERRRVMKVVEGEKVKEKVRKRLAKMKKAEKNRARRILLNWYCRQLYADMLRKAIADHKKEERRQDLDSFIKAKRDFQKKKRVYFDNLKEKVDAEREFAIAHRERTFERMERESAQRVKEKAARDEAAAKREAFLMKKFGMRWLKLVRQQREYNKNYHDSVWKVRRQLMEMVSNLKAESGHVTFTNFIKGLIKMKPGHEPMPDMTPETREIMNYILDLLIESAFNTYKKTHRPGAKAYEKLQNRRRILGKRELTEKDFKYPDFKMRQKPVTPWLKPDYPCRDEVCRGNVCVDQEEELWGVDEGMYEEAGNLADEEIGRYMKGLKKEKKPGEEEEGDGRGRGLKGKSPGKAEQDNKSRKSSIKDRKDGQTASVKWKDEAEVPEIQAPDNEHDRVSNSSSVTAEDVVRTSLEGSAVPDTSDGQPTRPTTGDSLDVDDLVSRAIAKAADDVACDDEKDLSDVSKPSTSGRSTARSSSGSDDANRIVTDSINKAVAGLICGDDDGPDSARKSGRSSDGSEDANDLVGNTLGDLLKKLSCDPPDDSKQSTSPPSLAPSNSSDEAKNIVAKVVKKAAADLACDDGASEPSTYTPLTSGRDVSGNESDIVTDLVGDTMMRAVKGLSCDDKDFVQQTIDTARELIGCELDEPESGRSDESSSSELARKVIQSAKRKLSCNDGAESDESELVDKILKSTKKRLSCGGDPETSRSEASELIDILKSAKKRLSCDKGGETSRSEGSELIEKILECAKKELACEGAETSTSERSELVDKILKCAKKELKCEGGETSRSEGSELIEKLLECARKELECDKGGETSRSEGSEVVEKILECAKKELKCDGGETSRSEGSDLVDKLLNCAKTELACDGTGGETSRSEGSDLVNKTLTSAKTDLACNEGQQQDDRGTGSGAGEDDSNRGAQPGQPSSQPARQRHSVHYAPDDDELNESESGADLRESEALIHVMSKHISQDPLPSLSTLGSGEVLHQIEPITEYDSSPQHADSCTSIRREFRSETRENVLRTLANVQEQLEAIKEELRKYGVTIPSQQQQPES